MSNERNNANQPPADPQNPATPGPNAQTNGPQASPTRGRAAGPIRNPAAPRRAGQEPPPDYQRPPYLSYPPNQFGSQQGLATTVPNPDLFPLQKQSPAPADGYAAMGQPPYATIGPAQALQGPLHTATQGAASMELGQSEQGWLARLMSRFTLGSSNTFVAWLGVAFAAVTIALSGFEIGLTGGDLLHIGPTLPYGIGSIGILVLSLGLGFWFFHFAIRRSAPEQSDPQRKTMGRQPAPSEAAAPAPGAPQAPATTPGGLPPVETRETGWLAAQESGGIEPTPEPDPAFTMTPFVPQAPAQFQNNEPPAELGDRYDHKDAFARPQKPTADGWATLGVSLRGLSHMHDAKFREDAITGACLGSWQFAVVADGGGSYSLSRVGAHVGAKAALQGMIARLSVLNRMPGAIDPAGRPATLNESLRTVLTEGFQQASTALQIEAQTRGVPSRDMYTTLLLVAHVDLGGGRHLVGGAQVGDGAIVARVVNAAGESRLIRLNSPDIGASNNETVFFQSVQPSEWQGRIFTEIVEGAQCYCLAMTDGISDDFTPLDQSLEQLEKPLFNDVLAGKTPEAALPGVESLLGYKRAGSFDDRSLVCIYNTRERPWK